MEPKSHWEQVYTANAPEAVSGYRPQATRSLTHGMTDGSVLQ